LCHALARLDAHGCLKWDDLPKPRAPLKQSNITVDPGDAILCGHLAHGNLRKRVLYPLLERLKIPRAGLHAFRHSRVTQLRKAGTPQDLQKQWIGHSSLTSGDRYSHTHEELEYRKSAAGNVGLDRVLSPS
jgi:integrase